MHLVPWPEAEDLCREEARRLRLEKGVNWFDQDDAVQAAMLTLFNRCDAGDEGVTVPNESDVALIRRIIRCSIVDSIRTSSPGNRNRYEKAEEPVTAAVIGVDSWLDDATPADVIPVVDARLDMKTAMAELPERIGRVLAATAWGYTQAEIAVDLGVSAVRVKQLVSAGREAVKAHVNNSREKLPTFAV
jgi:RNA polymerase sigma factor (sigma-70 family)